MKCNQYRNSGWVGHNTAAVESTSIIPYSAEEERPSLQIISPKLHDVRDFYFLEFASRRWYKMLMHLIVKFWRKFDKRTLS